MSLRRFLSNIYFKSLLLTKQCFTPILAYRRSSVVVNRSEKIGLFKKKFSDLFTTTEDLLYESIGVKHCFVSNKLLK